MAFEWDHQKDLANQQKHGVAFKEESTVFGDPLAWFQHDMDYSHAEERFLLLGRSSHLFQACAIREEWEGMNGDSEPTG